MRIISLFLSIVLIVGCDTKVTSQFELRVSDKALLEQIEKLPQYYPVWDKSIIFPVADKIFEVSTKELMPEVQGALKFEGENKEILTWYLDSFKLKKSWKILNWSNNIETNAKNQSIAPGDDPDSTWQDAITASIVAKFEEENITLQLLFKKFKNPDSVEVDYTAIRNR